MVLDDLAKSSEEILEGSSDNMLDELLALGGHHVVGKDSYKLENRGYQS